MSTPFILREMQPDDSPVLVKLIESAPLLGEGVRFTTRFVVEPYAAWHLLRPNMVGVVAETPDTHEIVGVATVAFDHYRIEGQERTVAFLGNLKVHHDHRRQGLATQLAAWRIAAARKHCGDDVLVMSGTMSDNEGSLSTMKTWDAQFMGPVIVAAYRTTAEDPISVPGITIRSPLEAHLPIISGQTENFYRDYNLYPLYTPEFLHTLLTTTPQVYHYRLAVDKGGRPLAGMLISNRAALMVDEITHPSGQELNLLPDTVRVAELGGFWYTDLVAAQVLWQHIQWEFSALVNTISVVFDPRSRMNEVFQIERTRPMQFSMTVSISSSVNLNAAKPISLGVRS